MGEIIANPKIYYSICNNKLCRKPKNGETPTTETYTNSKNEVQTKTAVFVNGYEGLIKKMSIENNEYEGHKYTTLNLSFDDNGNDVVVQLPERLMLSFIKVAHNIDFSKPIKIVPYRDVKKNAKLSIKQNEIPVESFYEEFVKDDKGKIVKIVHKNGLEKILRPNKDAGTKHWEIYFAQVSLILDDDFKNIIIPKFNKYIDSLKPQQSQQPYQQPQMDAISNKDMEKPFSEPENDDLPF